jgi:uncharacterized protein YdhG (YjbR/CyaY superfamily)
MEPQAAAPTTVDAYIAQFPPDVRAILEKLRAAIKEAAPEAAEGMAYRMPAYSLDGPLVYFAAFKNHIGFYPLPEAIEDFEERLAPYAKGKGSIQFPLPGEPPYGLVQDIVRARVATNRVKAAAQNKKK